MNKATIVNIVPKLVKRHGAGKEVTAERMRVCMREMELNTRAVFTVNLHERIAADKYISCMNKELILEGGDYQNWNEDSFVIERAATLMGATLA